MITIYATMIMRKVGGKMSIESENKKQLARLNAKKQMNYYKGLIDETSVEIEKCNNILASAGNLNSSVESLRGDIEKLTSQIYDAIKEESRGAQQAREKCSTISNQVASLEGAINTTLSELQRILSSYQNSYSSWRAKYNSLC